MLKIEWIAGVVSILLLQIEAAISKNQQRTLILPEIPPLITMDMIMSGRVPDCDDGKTNLTVDWNGWAGDYWCFDERWTTPTNEATKASPSCGPKPPNAVHYCMTDTLSYQEIPPSSGNHRPSWPMYGEYTYVPPQRWLHSLEHGAVVFLYHPCADTGEVEKLRKIVTGCLRRHIITPYNKLPRKTPFALVTWGCKLLMNSVETETAVTFIKGFAKNGPEDIETNGQFNEMLRIPAATVTDLKDSRLCPNFNTPEISKIRKFFM